MFVCLADAVVPKRSAYKFLEGLKNTFVQMYTREHIAEDIAFGVSFTDELKGAMVKDFGQVLV